MSEWSLVGVESNDCLLIGSFSRNVHAFNDGCRRFNAIQIGTSALFTIVGVFMLFEVSPFSLGELLEAFCGCHKECQTSIRYLFYAFQDSYGIGFVACFFGYSQIFTLCLLGTVVEVMVSEHDSALIFQDMFNVLLVFIC